MQTKLFSIKESKPAKKLARKHAKKQITITLMRATNRKYYLHYRCKKIGIRLNKIEKQLSGNEDSLKRRWPIELRNKYGYNLQTTIV